MAKVSNSNTKAEILRAYDELLAQLKAEKAENTALQKKISEQKTLVEKASQQAKEGATLNIQTIRKAINQQLDLLESSIEEEQVKFNELQKAVAIEKDTLENLYKIKAEAESLEALIITNRQSKEQLEKEQEEQKKILKESIEAIKLQWKREQEEYDYKTKITRRNDQDTYEQKKVILENELNERKTSFEKEISEREKIVAAQEEEFNKLKQEAESFATTLEKGIQEAKTLVEKQLTREFEYKQKLEIKDLEAELKLREQAIENLKAKVLEQQKHIELLSSRTDDASLQVKDIALKAIENAGLRSLNLSSPERKGKQED